VPEGSWRKVIDGIEVCTGAIPATPEHIAARRVSLAQARGLAVYHEDSLSAGPVINSANFAAIRGSGWTTKFRHLSNGGFPYDSSESSLPVHGNCVTAQEAHSKQIISTATAPDVTTAEAHFVDVPRGADYANGGPVSPWPQPGVVPWCAKNGLLEGAGSTGVMDLMSHDGIYDASLVQHTNGVLSLQRHYGFYASFNWTDQNEVRLALQYFKTINLNINSNGLTGWASHFCTTVVTPGGDHEICCCDCGTAAELASAYGVSVPEGVSADDFCVGIITWGAIAALTWPCFLGMTAGAWVRLTDPDRYDASTFNPVAEQDFVLMRTNPDVVRRGLAELTLCS
jgi:hypothetical protein